MELEGPGAKNRCPVLSPLLILARRRLGQRSDGELARPKRVPLKGGRVALPPGRWRGATVGQRCRRQGEVTSSRSVRPWGRLTGNETTLAARQPFG